MNGVPVKRATNFVQHTSVCPSCQRVTNETIRVELWHTPVSEPAADTEPDA